MPVRLAKPTDTIGLFDTLRDPSYSCAVGLVKYASGGYTKYEIDVNKKMLCGQEEDSIPQPEAPIIKVVNPQPSEEYTPPPIPKEPDPLSKFWQWVTNLF